MLLQKKSAPAKGSAEPGGRRKVAEAARPLAEPAIPLYLTAAGALRRSAAPGNPPDGGGDPAPPHFPYLQRCAACAGGPLAVGAAHAPEEREAERAAERVMRMPAPPCSCGGTCAECRARAEEPRLQPARPAGADGSAGVAPPVVHEAIRGGGQPLDAGTRAFMEPRFGRDFGAVRVHTGARADASARAVDALAYTVGPHVAFRSGEYAPHTGPGRRLLAHELAHVVQQGAGAPRVQRSPLVGSGAPAVDVTQIPLTGGKRIERIVISCADGVLALIASEAVYIYRTDVCDMPLGKHQADVSPSKEGAQMTLRDVPKGARAHVSYQIRKGQLNPAPILVKQKTVTVDVVEHIKVPEFTQENPCLMAVESKDVIPSAEIKDKELFPAQDFEKELWRHTILLGEFGWLDAVASASGKATSGLSAGYGPGRITDVCLAKPLGNGKLAGTARFTLPAYVDALVTLDGSLKLSGDFLSIISLAAIEGTLTAGGSAHASAGLDAHVEVVYDPAGAQPWSLKLASRLGFRASLGFTLDTALAVTILGSEIWRQRWDLVNASVGADWEVALVVGTDLKPSLEVGTLRITPGTAAAPVGPEPPTAASAAPGPPAAMGVAPNPAAAGDAPAAAAAPPAAEPEAAAAPGAKPAAPDAPTAAAAPPAGDKGAKSGKGGKGGKGGKAGEIVGALVSAVLDEALAKVTTSTAPAVKAPAARQLMGRETTRVAIDPKLTEETRKWRLRNTKLDDSSFRRNVAVFKVEVDGAVQYITEANDEGELHSESNVLKQLQAKDPHFRRTKILAVYTEREPCVNCASDLAFVRRALQQDFPIYFTVSQSVAPQKRAEELRKAYLGK